MNLSKMTLSELNTYILKASKTANTRLSALEKFPFYKERSRSYSKIGESFGTVKNSAGCTVFFRGKSSNRSEALKRASALRSFLGGDSKIKDVQNDVLKAAGMRKATSAERRDFLSSQIKEYEKKKRKARREASALQLKRELVADVSTLKKSEADALIRKLSGIANQRLRTLERTESTEYLDTSRAYMKILSLAYSGKYDFIKYNKAGDIIFAAGKSKNIQEARRELAELQKFLSAKSSTVSGIKEIEKNIVDKIRENYDVSELSTDKILDFWKSGAVQEHKKIFGSGETIKILEKHADELNQEQIDSIFTAGLESGKNVDIIEQAFEKASEISGSDTFRAVNPAELEEIKQLFL